MYLPIAEMSVEPFLIILLGMAVGFLSGMFGIGGGFLLTPLLIFAGIPPTVAVGTGAAQIVASSASGATAQFQRGTIDFKMGGVLILGGAVGSAAGVFLFRELSEAGQAEAFISIAYVVFLTLVGLLMLLESLHAIVREPRPGGLVRRKKRVAWMAALPVPMRFRKSQLYISPGPPFLLGAVIGLLMGIMGLGGGFLMVPAMIYVLQMPTPVVVGTSLFQIVFVAAIATVLHAAVNQTVDAFLMTLLVVGGVLGAQLGTRAGVRLKAEQLRAALALIVLAAGMRLLLDLVLPPHEPYVVETL
jgi:hypothetical protein